LNRFLSVCLVTLYGLFFTTDLLANCSTGEERVASCQIAGQAQHVSICLSSDKAIYRFGSDQEKPELLLRASLMELGYLRTGGVKNTISETVTFSQGDYSYQTFFGFRDGLQPDPIELHEYGTVKVLHKNKTIAELNCASETIDRAHDLLLDRMRKLGRERTTDGEVFPNYQVQFPGPVSESPPCEQKDSNVDTCWSLGVAAERGGDLALALGYYDKSCDAQLGQGVGAGCYDAGKLYLQSKKLRDYARAYDRFTRVCDSGDIGEGPYACKYLGWMHHTGIGAKKDPKKAWRYLSEACFLQNDDLYIDAEGCHFFAEAVSNARPPKGEHDKLKRQASDYLIYLALAMGCADGAKGVCAEATSFLASGMAASATWISRCDQDIDGIAPAVDCAGLIKHQENYDYDVNQALRRQILSRFHDTQDAWP
jgi:TPR repeat protein